MNKSVKILIISLLFGAYAMTNGKLYEIMNKENAQNIIFSGKFFIFSEKFENLEKIHKILENFKNVNQKFEFALINEETLPDVFTELKISNGEIIYFGSELNTVYRGSIYALGEFLERVESGDYEYFFKTQISASQKLIDEIIFKIIDLLSNGRFIIYAISIICFLMVLCFRKITRKILK